MYKAVVISSKATVDALATNILATPGELDTANHSRLSTLQHAFLNTSTSTMSTPQEAISPPTNIFLPLLQPGPGHKPARQLYADHRATRDAAQRALLLNPAVPLVTDPVLSTILSTCPPDYALDARHNLSIWARPSAQVKELVVRVQERLREAVGDDQGQTRVYSRIIY